MCRVLQYNERSGMIVSDKTSNQAAAHPPPLGGRSQKITEDHPGSRESKAALTLCSEWDEVEADFHHLDQRNDLQL